MTATIVSRDPAKNSVKLDNKEVPGRICRNLFMVSAVSLERMLLVSASKMNRKGLALAIVLLLAASISVACVVGRYHYVVDALAGGALALVIWGIVNAAGL